jgi:hypothetical protein
MKLSEERTSHLSHLIQEGLWNDDLLDYADDVRALRALQTALAGLAANDERIDGAIRDKLQKQNKVPGSNEWRIMYDKYYQEEMEKRR